MAAIHVILVRYLKCYGIRTCVCEDYWNFRFVESLRNIVTFMGDENELSKRMSAERKILRMKKNK